MRSSTAQFDPTRINSKSMRSREEALRNSIFRKLRAAEEQVGVIDLFKDPSPER
jgi:hypothetical protein